MSGRRQTLAGTALLAVAMAVALVAWRGASGSSQPSDALSYLVSGGLGGVFIAAVAFILLAMAHLGRTITQLQAIQHNHTEARSSESQERG